MRRIVIALTVAICVIVNTLPIWAAGEEQTVIQPEPEINAPYIHVNKIIADMSISGGMAKCKVTVITKMDKDVDYGQVTAVIKKNSGTTVKTFTQRVNAASRSINWTASHKLPAKGKYYLQATVKLYKNGKLVETITDKTANKTY